MGGCGGAARARAAPAGTRPKSYRAPLAVALGRIRNLLRLHYRLSRPWTWRPDATGLDSAATSRCARKQATVADRTAAVLDADGVSVLSIYYPPNPAPYAGNKPEWASSSGHRKVRRTGIDALPQVGYPRQRRSQVEESRMRQNEQQADTEHPEGAPVAAAPTRPKGGRPATGEENNQRVAADKDRDDRPEFRRPAPVPSAFGAPSVGGAVAASALAGRAEEAPDARAESTARPGDGAVDMAREGWRADPTAEFRGGPGWVQRRAERASATAEPSTAQSHREQREDGAPRTAGSTAEQRPDAGGMAPNARGTREGSAGTDGRATP